MGQFDDLHIEALSGGKGWILPTLEVARLAGITELNKAQKFALDLDCTIFIGARQVIRFRERGRKNNTRLIKAERAVRDAYDAVRALNEMEQRIIQRAFWTSFSFAASDYSPTDVNDLPILSLLSCMVEGFSKVTGKSPSFEARGRTRPRGTVNDWQFQKFVGGLWCIVREHGGDLKFSRKENRPYGTMAAALTILRPLFPGLIPTVLPSKAILAVKKSLVTKKSRDYWIFGCADAISM